MDKFRVEIVMNAPVPPVSAQEVPPQQAEQVAQNVPPEEAGAKKVLDIAATSYAPGPHDNDQWGNKKGVCSSGDTGGAIKGHRIDVAKWTVKEAYRFGVKPVKVYVLNTK